MEKAPHPLENTLESSRSKRVGVSASPVDSAFRKRRNNFLVMAVLGVDVISGTTIAIAGHLLENDAIALGGAGLATLGLILMLVYQLLGRER